MSSSSRAAQSVVVIGAGLVGTLLSVFLARRGYRVRVFEKKPDLRRSPVRAGRSINLTLCHRGLAALDRVGAGDLVRAIAIPAYGRQVHVEDGDSVFQPYGGRGEALYAVTRNELNRVLLDFAERSHGVEFRFQHRCSALRPEEGAFTLEDLESGDATTSEAFWILGADGAFSAVRQCLQRSERFDFSQAYLADGYKELTVPAAVAAEWGLNRNALHIWPRGRFMLIGFANLDGSLTLALHLPYEGESSFESIRSEEDLQRLFSSHFPDTLGRIPDLAGNYFGRPVSAMLTVRCFPWVRGRVALIGDAAHAIVPSYGQGTNAGFEDCAYLDDCLDRHPEDWSAALAAYQAERKPNADAIADLSLSHFAEIRERIGDPRFLLRKALERELEELYPDYRSLYSMISFTSMTYLQALEVAKNQEQLLDRLLESEGLGACRAGEPMEEAVREGVRRLLARGTVAAGLVGPAARRREARDGEGSLS